MARARADYDGVLPAVLDSRPPRFTQAQLRRLRAICSRPGFVEAVTDAAARFRLQSQVRKLPPNVTAATLADLAQRADDLWRLVQKVAPDIRRRVDARYPAHWYKQVDGLPTGAMGLHLAMFAEAARAAQRTTKVAPGRRKNNAERTAAREVRQLFKQHRIPFRLSDDRRAREENAAAFCIRLVLGRPDLRVEHLLPSSLRK